MAEVSRYGDIAGVLLDDWEEGINQFGRATTAPPSPEDQKAFTDAIPAVTAGAVQAGMQVFPQLRALSTAGRGLLTLAGGAGGASGGEYLRQRLTGEQIDPDKIAQAGIENLMFDVGGNVLFKYGGKLITVPYTQVRKMLNKNYGDPVEGSVDEAAVVAQKWLQERDPKATLTKYQAQPTMSNALQEGIARASVLSGGALKNVDQRQIDVISNELNKLTSNANITREEFGSQFKSIIDAGEEALQAWAGPRYTAIDNLGYGIKVNLKGVKGEAKVRLKDLQDIASYPEKQSFIQQQILAIPSDSLTFSQARAKLSDLKAFQRSLESTDPRQELVGNTITQIENAMDASAKQGGTEVYNFYRKVNEEYKQMSKSLRGDIIVDAMSKNPERVGEYLFRNGNVTEIKEAYGALKNIVDKNANLTQDVVQMVETFQDSYLRSLFGSIKDESTLKQALKYADEQKETLEAVLSGATQFKGVKGKTAAVQAMLNAMEYSAKRPDSVMSLFIASKETGGITSLVSGSVATVSSLVAAMPTILARTAADPKKVNELLKINRTSLKVGLTDQVVSKLVQIANDLGINLDDFSQEEPQPTQAQPQAQPQQPQDVDISDLLNRTY